MVFAGDDDGSLLVAQALNELECRGVFGEVDLRVVQSLLVECAVGRVALDTHGLGVDGDRHGRTFQCRVLMCVFSAVYPGERNM